MFETHTSRLRINLFIKSLTLVLLVLLLTKNAVETYLFAVSENPNLPSYSNAMTIDSESYLQKGLELSNTKHPWFTLKTTHAIGMQVVLAYWFILFPEGNIDGFKVMQVIIWLATILILALLVWRYLGSVSFALIAAALLSSSLLFSRYTAILQYEVITTLLIVILAAVLMFRVNAASSIIAGLLIAILAIFRVHFMLFLVPVLFVLYLHPKRLKMMALTIGAFLLIAIPWNLAYSIKLQRAFWFQSHVVIHINRALSPTAQGHNFPPPERLPDHSAVQFVVKQPVSYVQLLFNRFGYLTGLTPDAWFIESRFTDYLSDTMSMLSRETWRFVFFVVWMSSFLFGLWVVVRSSTPELSLPMRFLPAAFILVLLAPHLIVNSSTRFAISILPFLVYYQTIGIQFLTTKLLERGWENKDQ